MNITSETELTQKAIYFADGEAAIEALEQQSALLAREIFNRKANLLQTLQ